MTRVPITMCHGIQPKPPPFRLLLRHFQAFPSPETLHPLMIHFPAFPAKQLSHPAVAVPTVLRGQPDHVLHQPWLVVRYVGLATLRRAGLPQNSASPSLRHSIRSQSISHVLHGLTSLCRADQFPDVASLRIALSSSASANSFFSRWFSFSSPFNRLA